MRDCDPAPKPGRWFLPTLCMLALSSYAAPIAKKRPQEEALQFLNRVRETTHMDAPASPPIRLQAHVVAAPVERGKPQLEGTYVLTWASPDRWKEEVTFPGYHRVRIASQRKLWTAADPPAEPLRVYQLSQLFDLRSQWTLHPGESASLQKAKTYKGIRTQCVRIKGHLQSAREVCADASTLLPVGTRNWSEYAEFQPVAGKQFPSVMRAFGEGGNLVLEVRVNRMAPANSDESVFQPPPQAVSWDWCADAEPPQVIEARPPAYPPAARANGQQGVVYVYAVVGVDGSPHGLGVLRSAGRDFDAAALAAVLDWKFRPAMCGDKPVPSEKIIEVTYALGE